MALTTTAVVTVATVVADLTTLYGVMERRGGGGGGGGGACSVGKVKRRDSWTLSWLKLEEMKEVSFGEFSTSRGPLWTDG